MRGGARSAHGPQVSLPGVGTGARQKPRTHQKWSTPHGEYIGMPGSLNDGQTDGKGMARLVECPRCYREYEAGRASERRGKRCIVDGALLFPDLGT